MTNEESNALQQVIERLEGRFPERGPSEVSRRVAQVHRQYDGRPVRAFVPVLVEREVADQLAASPGRRADRVAVSA